VTRWWPPLALAVGAVVAFLDGLWPGRGLFFRDHLLVFRPRWWFASEALGNGTLPLLTRSSPTGVPLEAQLNGTYTPMTLVFAALPFDAAYDVFVVGHVVLMGVGAYLLARHLGASALEGLVAGAVASLSGPVLSFENLLIALQGLAWAPWMYLAYHRLLTHGRVVDAGLVALAIGFHLQGITPFVAALDVFAALLLTVHARPAPNMKLGGLLLAGGALGLGIAAIELFPVLEALSTVRRGGGFGYAERAMWAVKPAHALDLIAPGAWALPEHPHLFFKSLSSGKVTAYLVSLYVGLALPLGGLALFDRGARPWVFVLAGLVAFFGLMALGPMGFVHPIVSELPLLKSSRFPVKYMADAAVFLAALAPFGLRVAGQKPRLAAAFFGAHAAIAAGALMTFGMPEMTEYVATIVNADSNIFGVHGVEPAEYPALAVEAMRPRILHGAAFAGLATIVAAVCSTDDRRAYVMPALAVAVLLDLSLAGRWAVFGAPLEPSSMPEAILERVASDQDRVFPLTPGGRYVPVQTTEGDTPLAALLVSDRVRGYKAYRQIRRLEDTDPDGMSHPASHLATRLLGRSTQVQAQRLLARSGAAWVSSWLTDRGVDATRIDIPDQRPHFVWPVADVRPYVAGYDRWQTIDLRKMKLDQAVAAYTDDATWDVALPLAPNEVGSSTVACAGPPTATLREGATDTRYEIDVDGECATFVVLREVAVDGWTATIDDSSATVVPAEFGSLGALVPAGAHRLVFEYPGRAMRWAWLSLISALIALGLAVLGCLPRRRGAP